MEFTIRTNLLQKIMKGAEEFAADLNFFCYKENVKIQASGYDKDHKNKVLADIFLTPDVDGVDGVLVHYSFSREKPLFIGLKIKDLIDKLKCTGDDAYFITMEPEEEDASELIVSFTLLSKDGRKGRPVMVPMRILSSYDLYIPDEDYNLPNSTAIVTALEFPKKCVDFSFCKESDDHVLICIPRPMVLQFSVVHDNWWHSPVYDNLVAGNRMGKELVQHDVETPLFCGPVLHRIQLKYLKCFKYLTECKAPASKVAISIGSNNFVVIIEYYITHRFYQVLCGLLAAYKGH